MIITLPWPPSVNHYWIRQRKGYRISQAGLDFRHDVWKVVFVGRIASFRSEARIGLMIKAYPPDRRARDLDNLCKAPLDALTHSGAWGDDAQIDQLTIVRCAVEKPGRLCVEAWEIGKAEDHPPTNSHHRRKVAALERKP